jgi:hypothetical protein
MSSSNSWEAKLPLGTPVMDQFLGVKPHQTKCQVGLVTSFSLDPYFANTLVNRIEKIQKKVQTILIVLTGENVSYRR